MPARLSAPFGASSDRTAAFPPSLWPCLAVVVALLVQGAAGRPAPPVFRPEIEGVVALALIFAAGLRAPIDVALGGGPQAPRWFVVGAACLFVLLWPPLIRAAWEGRSLQDAARDVVPLLFLFAPLALVPALRRAGEKGGAGGGAGRVAGLLTAAFMAEGLFFVLRWWRHADWGFGALGVRTLSDGGAYLLNAPSVLFAAVAWPLAALHCLEKGGLPRLFAAGAALIAGALCVGALLGAAHRLAFVLIVVAAAVAVWTRRRRIPWLIPALAVAAAAVFALEGERLIGALFAVVEKTRQIGGNARMEEAAAALTAAGESPAGLLFGGGWGLLIENPAVGGWRVSYTHTFVTYLLLKAGLVGLIAGVVWLGVFSPAAFVLLRRDPAWAAAVCAPLVVSFTVHTSYKYLDAGVLLTLLMLKAADELETPDAKRR